ncbi:hypothetical protein SNE40_004065 [Patella caerulea]|uniref:Uncharacterized protein n=1 Tax=Patella caerulea TaxID=87958 RepID=A0AAN8K460_PATCE
MCSVDFTTMNKGAWGWIAFFIASTGAAPYIMIAVCAIMTFWKWSYLQFEHRTQDLVQSRKFFYGCLISVPLYFPYFIVNLSNYYGNYVSPTLNVFVMILYYGSNLLPCALLSPRYLCKTVERSSTSGSIRESETEDQEEFEMEIIPDNQL